jgi:hypothetical protein
MMNESSKQTPLSYDELLQQNQALLSEMDKLNAQNTVTWNLLADTSRKLQVYSASIKAAVSSLLNYDIFWDSANQHEFLETINSSVNQVSDLIVLLTLAFRSQANSLVLKNDEQMLQEILSFAQTSALKKWPDIRLEVSYPPEGKPVLVDYEYLTKTLLFIYEVFFARGSAGSLRVVASEIEDCWFLDFIGLDPIIIEVIDQICQYKTQPDGVDFLSAENILRLHIVCEILHLQNISANILEEPGHLPILRLCIPIYKQS